MTLNGEHTPQGSLSKEMDLLPSGLDVMLLSMGWGVGNL